jgi:hypothetical protein
MTSLQNQQPQTQINTSVQHPLNSNQLQSHLQSTLMQINNTSSNNNNDDDDTRSVDTQQSTASSITSSSPEAQQIKGTIKEWLSIDNEIAKYTVQISEINKKKKELLKKKENMAGTIQGFMSEHSVPFFNTPNDKIETFESKRTKALTKGDMFNLLSKFLKDENKATDAVNYINENRVVITQSKLRRKQNKNRK